MLQKILIIVVLCNSPVLAQAQKHAPRYSQPARRPGIYPEASQRLLRPSDMEGLTSWDLKVMRNEIYARHGYIFRTREMADYFSRQNWYNPRYEDVSSMLSAIEKKNVQFIQAYEG